MSVEALALVLHHSKASGTDKLILVGIANHAGDGGAWPTIATLARYGNVTDRTVQRSIERLVALGELTVQVNAGGFGNLQRWERPNRYEVHVACPATCDRTANHRERALPKAPAHLWTDPPTPTSPGVAHVTGVPTPTSPGGVTPTSPKPSLEPPMTTGSGSVTGPRASSGTTPACTECAAPNLDVCRARQAKLAEDDRHTYSPKPWSP